MNRNFDDELGDQHQSQSAIERDKLLGCVILGCGVFVVCVGIGICLLAETNGRSSAKDAIPRGDMGIVDMDEQTAKWYFDRALYEERAKHETIGVMITAVRAILGLGGFVLHRWGILQQMRFKVGAHSERERVSSRRLN